MWYVRARTDTDPLSEPNTPPPIQAERVDVQIRTYIWVPGVVTQMGYSEVGDSQPWTH